MMNKMMDWAVFGITGVIWMQASMWSEGMTYTNHGATMIVTVFTLMLMNGATSGSSVFEHMMSGVSGCVSHVIGWVVASVVYSLITQLMGGGMDMMMMVNSVIGTVITYVTAMLAMSAMNSIRA